MSNLWDLDHIQPAGTDVLAGDTIAAMFWNAVAERGPRVWMRQKELGIWKSWTWDQTAEAVREIAGGLMALVLLRANALPFCPTPTSNGCWPTWPC